MRGNNGHIISSDGVLDTGGDAICAATELFARLQRETRLSVGAPVSSLPVRPHTEPSAAAASPVRFYVPRLVDAEPAAHLPLSLAGMDVLYLSDASSPVPPSHRLLRAIPSAQACRPDVRVGDSATLISLPAALDHVKADTEAIVLVIDGSQYQADALLTEQSAALAAVLNALFAAVQHAHAGVSVRKVRVGTLVYHAWHAGVLNPLTGLFAGFIKSLRRDFPQSFVAAAVSDASLEASLPVLEAELARAPRDGILPEIFFRRGRRLREALALNDPLSSLADRRLFSEETVVVASGGARGVTAILLEGLLKRYGCRVIALGRTSTDGFPHDVLAMSEAQLREYEPEYYRRAVASAPATSPIAMRKQFEALAAANEVHRSIETLEAAGGSFEYLRVDITDARAVDAAIADIYARYGKVDVVIHGAGTQISKRIAKKTLDEFDLVVSSKLAGLRCLHSAVTRRAGSDPVDFHLLTSAFSFWGNDGQPDYGAANEALNRLAAAQTSANGLRGNWSSLAWLAWPSIGMAKEFSWLGAVRTLHPLGKEEGQRLFQALTGRAPAQAANILATQNELAYFKVPIAPSAEPRKLSESLDLSPSAAPYLADHVIDGIQTMPGAVEFFSAAAVALRLLPGMRFEALHHARFTTFLRCHADRPNNAKILARVLQEDPTGATVRVHICSDFIHASGRVIRQNVEHFSADVTCTRSASPPFPADAAAFEAVEPQGTEIHIEDPYIGKTPALQLKGMFDCLRDIRLGATHQFAELALPRALRESPLQAMLVPVLALDAMARVGTMLASGDSVTLCVPVAASSLQFYFDFSSNELFDLFHGARLIGTRPILSSDGASTLGMERMRAIAKNGTPLIEIRRSLAKVRGSVSIPTLLSTTTS